MGFFSLIKDAFSTLGDMKQLDSLQKELTPEFDQLSKEGKLPQEIETVYKKLKAMEEKGTDVKSDESIAVLKEFADVLEKNEDKLPESVHKVAEKYAKTTEALEKTMADVKAESDSLNK